MLDASTLSARPEGGKSAVDTALDNATGLFRRRRRWEISFHFKKKWKVPAGSPRQRVPAGESEGVASRGCVRSRTERLARGAKDQPTGSPPPTQ